MHHAFKLPCCTVTCTHSLTHLVAAILATYGSGTLHYPGDTHREVGRPVCKASGRQVMNALTCCGHFRCVHNGHKLTETVTHGTSACMQLAGCGYREGSVRYETQQQSKQSSANMHRKQLKLMTHEDILTLDGWWAWDKCLGMNNSIVWWSHLQLMCQSA